MEALASLHAKMKADSEVKAASNTATKANLETEAAVNTEAEGRGQRNKYKRDRKRR